MTNQFYSYSMSHRTNQLSGQIIIIDFPISVAGDGTTISHNDDNIMNRYYNNAWDV